MRSATERADRAEVPDEPPFGVAFDVEPADAVLGVQDRPDGRLFGRADLIADAVGHQFTAG
jgi:hypothetical protein